MDGSADRLQELALRLDSRRVLIAIGTIVVLLGVLDVLEIVFGSPFGIFDLNGERNVPAVFSAALWACTSVVALLLGRAEQPAAVARVWLALSALLLYVSADEFGEIHERLERITGVDWQILYAPLGLVAAGLWVLVGRRLRGLRAGFWLFLGGTVCGVVSQMIEERRIRRQRPAGLGLRRARRGGGGARDAGRGLHRPRAPGGAAHRVPPDASVGSALSLAVFEADPSTNGP